MPYRDLTGVTLVSEDHDCPDDHNECDDIDYHDNHDLTMKMKMMMIKVIIIKEVMTCDVWAVAIFCHGTRRVQRLERRNYVF